MNGAGALRHPSLAKDAAELFAVAGAGGLALAAYEMRHAKRLRQDPVPVLLFAHANGFSAGSYRPFFDMLGDRFRVFAYDARGHGGSAVPPEPLAETVTFDTLAGDLAAVAGAVRARVGQAPLYLAAHSFGGAVAVYLGGRYGNAPWTAATLFDPVLRPPPGHPEHDRSESTNRERVARTLRRRPTWESPAAYAAALSHVPDFAAWAQDMLDAHVAATLTPQPGGAWALSCPREVEAAVYRAMTASAGFEAAAAFPAPLHLVGADPQGPRASWIAEVQPKVAALRPGTRLSCLAGSGHLMVFERPAACRDIVAAMLEGP